jgi:ankyrin repeat protein
MSLLEELFEAVRRGDSKRVEELLGMGVNPNARAEGRLVIVAGRAQESVLECRNCTPLHVAAYAGHARIAKLLIKHGADVNAKDDLGLTPLHYAAYGRNARVIQVLLNSGADPLALDAYCRTPLDLLGFGRNPERLGFLLKSTLASAFRSKPERELFKAAAEGDPRKVREALARGANPNTWTGTGATPLHYAAFLGHAGVVKALLEGGAHVDPRDRDGRTPLHYAVAGGHVEVVNVLLSYGASPFTGDRWGLTPLDLAEILSREREAEASRAAEAPKEARVETSASRICEKCPYYLRRSMYCALLAVKVLDPAKPPCATRLEENVESISSGQPRAGTPPYASSTPVSAGDLEGRAQCPRCGSRLVYLRSLGRYYCFNCKSYIA